ncbi:Spy/CpxP family protein refolding chaperone [Dysgonomonas sp. PH5-45]|uniref:hypothetical protein n=1 Tax=unclassified Dysgonomonas TaxID=2630389 RepID=UPI002474A00A|nr:MULTISPECIES: hypothetical protein [unclassified Dysgonomonas]MDH6356092.1 Spy/CpxP family protein refolding chaperone [Dysgonomonas sp. PH5-45]MDH6388986.1 Spy/CpxP family protein refolding chaperone [Dysgonomonas sp. PH5-37]
MKKYLLLLILVIATFSVNAQQRKHGKKFDYEKFKKERADFIIKEVGLTNQEAKVFMPLCEELMRKKFELNRDVRKQSRDLNKKVNKTDRDYETVIDLSIENKAKEAQLEKEYYKRFKKVLSPQKIYKYQRAEMKFMKRTVKKD